LVVLPVTNPVSDAGFVLRCVANRVRVRAGG